MTLEQMQEELNNINRSIIKLCKNTFYDEWGDLEKVEADTDSANNNFLLEEYGRIMEKLHAASVAINYLNRPINKEGVLTKQANGRYTLRDRELTSGNIIEILIYDEYKECFKWLASRIEHNGKDYYVVGYSGSIEGLKGRLRG